MPLRGQPRPPRGQLKPAQASQRPVYAFERPGLASREPWAGPEALGGLSQPLRSLGGEGRTDRRTDGRMEGQTYVRTDRFPLYSTGLRPLRSNSLRGRCSKRIEIKFCKVASSVLSGLRGHSDSFMKTSFLRSSLTSRAALWP